MDLVINSTLFVTAFVAAFIGSNVGGTGLMIVPVLIFLGLSPQVAIGTRRLASLGQNTISLWRFSQDGKVHTRIGVGIAIVSIFGAYAGARLLLVISEDLMEKLLGLFILAILPFVLLKKDFGVIPRTNLSVIRKTIGYSLFFIVGFAASFFGGGGQVFGTVIIIACFGMTFLEAAGTRKIASIAFTVTSLIVYIMADLIIWRYGLILLAGSTIGGYAGSHYGLKKGDLWVRKLFVGMMTVLSVKLLV